jgi:hypothetical protein
MAAPVVAVRRLEFCAGPEHLDFYACAEHRPLLDAADVSCFFGLRTHQTRDVAPDEAEHEDCYFCRER